MPKIQFTCPNCQAKYSALPDQAGKQGTCKNCGGNITVPKSEHKHIVQGTKNTESDNFGRYWFGYIYAIFVGYLTIVSFLNFLSVFIQPDRSLTKNINVGVENWTIAILSLVAAIWLGYVCVRLFRQKFSLALIYTVSGLHAASVIMRGIIPNEVFYWVLLSGYAIYFFRKLDKTRIELETIAQKA